MKKNNFRNIFFFGTFWKITVGGFVNQLIKKFWPKGLSVKFSIKICISVPFVFILGNNANYDKM